MDRSSSEATPHVVASIKGDSLSTGNSQGIWDSPSLWPLPRAVLAFFIVSGLAFLFGCLRLSMALLDVRAINHAQAKISSGAPEVAVEILEPLVGKYPGNHRVQLLLARAYIESGDWIKGANILSSFTGQQVTIQERDEIEALRTEVSHLIDPPEPPVKDKNRSKKPRPQIRFESEMRGVM